MTTLTLITPARHLNHHYELESAALRADWYLSMIIKEENIDNFLQDFIDGKTGYKVQIDSDTMTLTLKDLYSVENRVDEGDYVAFSINVNKINS